MLECKTTSLEVSLIQASTTNEVTMWQRGGPHCLCIVEGQCSASPVIWVKSYGAGGGAEKLSEEELGTVEERAFGREGEENIAPEGLCGFFV